MSSLRLCKISLCLFSPLAFEGHALCQRWAKPVLSERGYKRSRQEKQQQLYGLSQQTGLFRASFFLLHFPFFSTVSSIKCQHSPISFPLHKYITKDVTLIHTRQKQRTYIEKSKQKRNIT